MKIFEELWVLNEPIKGHNHAMIHKRTCLQLIIKNHALESLLIVFLSPSPSSRLLSCEMVHQPLRYTGGNGKFLQKEKKNRQNRVCRGITRFDGCWGSAVVVAVAAVYMAAWWQGRAGLMKWHFSFCVLLLVVCQPVITTDSANWLGRGTLRSREKSWQRWRMGGRGERYRKRRNRSLLSRSVWWLLIIFSSRRRVAENSLIS